jgi:hypothetical protein
MNNIRKKSITFLVLFILAISCTKDFDRINSNPNEFSRVPPENVMAGVIKKTIDLVGGRMNNLMFLVYAEHAGGLGGQFPSFYYTESEVNNMWNSFYVDILKPLNLIGQTYGDDPMFSNRVQIARIWECYVYAVMVSFWGDIPRSEAMVDKLSIKYDTEEEIYIHLLSTLKEAAEAITTTGDKLSRDPVYNGDNLKWKKFANSLRLRLAMRVSTGFPDLAQTHAREVLKNPGMLISANSENAKMQWGTDEANWSYNYTRYIYGVYNPNTAIKVNETFMLYMTHYGDGRMDAFTDPADVPYWVNDSLMINEGTANQKVVAVSYPFPLIGKPKSLFNLAAWDLSGQYNYLQGLATENFANFDRINFMAPDMKYDILTYAETCFLKAEAALIGWEFSPGQAESFYYAGIDASFDQWGISSRASAYKALDGIKWGTSSQGIRDYRSLVTCGIPADPLHKIVVQQWIALFGNGHDAWCLRRRTRQIPFPPHTGPDNAYGGIPYLETPERMIYPPIEGSLNAASYNDAVARYDAGNPMYAYLKIAKPYTPVKWENVIPKYNNDFAHHYYGNKVSDLIAKGIPYTILNQ